MMCPSKPSWKSEFKAECLIENDANAGAVAEHRFGAGKGCQNMVFLTMGTGLGAGVITDGRLYRGSNDLAGEVGHLRLTRTGPIGHNKKGSAEGWASGGGMAQVAQQAVAAALKKKRPTRLAKLYRSGGPITAKDIGMAARQGDNVALEVLEATGEKLGEVLAILVDLLNPDRIVIGGLAMRLGDLLLEPARRVIKREALELPARTCQVIPGRTRRKHRRCRRALHCHGNLSPRAGQRRGRGSGWRGELAADIRDRIQRQVGGVPVVGPGKPKGLLHVLGGLSLLQAHLHLGHEPFQKLAEIHQILLASRGAVAGNVGVNVPALNCRNTSIQR